eukprot:COSAG02_NODE_1014_length_15195_cov_11.098105_6_plen_513_part_00
MLRGDGLIGPEMGGGRRRLTAARRKGGPKSSPRRGECSSNGTAGVLLDSRGLPSMAAPIPMHLLAVSRCLPAESGDVNAEGATATAPRDCGLELQIEAANSSEGEAPCRGDDQQRSQTSADAAQAILVVASDLSPQPLGRADISTAKPQASLSPTHQFAAQGGREKQAAVSVVELEPVLAASSLPLAARKDELAAEDTRPLAQAHAVDSPGSPVEPVAHPRQLERIRNAGALASGSSEREELLVEESESMSESESESDSGSESESDSDSEPDSDSESESNVSASDVSEAGAAVRKDVRIGRPRRVVQSSKVDEESGPDSGSESDSTSDSDNEDVTSGSSSSEDDFDEVDEDIGAPSWSQNNRKRWPVRSQPTHSMRGRHTPPPPMETVTAKRQKLTMARLDRGASASAQKAEEEITPPAGNVSMQPRVKARPCSSRSRAKPRPDRPVPQRRHNRGRGRGTKRGGSSNSDKEQSSAKLAEPAISDATNSVGRRASGRNRAAPVAFWTLDGLSR